MSTISTTPISSMFANAQQGVQRGLELSARASHSLAEGRVDPENMAMLIEGQRTVEAGLAVMRAADETTGTLLDAKA